MASHSRVFNLTSGCRIKRSQALGRIAHCLSEWVEPGVSIRNLTLAETVARRSAQARLEEPLPLAEIPGLIYRPSPTAEISTQHEQKLARIANQFAAEAVA